MVVKGPCSINGFVGIAFNYFEARRLFDGLLWIFALGKSFDLKKCNLRISVQRERLAITRIFLFKFSRAHI